MDGDGNIFAWLIGLYLFIKFISFALSLVPIILVGVGIFMLISFIFTKSLEKYDENKHRKETCK